MTKRKAVFSTETFSGFLEAPPQWGASIVDRRITMTDTLAEVGIPACLRTIVMGYFGHRDYLLGYWPYDKSKRGDHQDDGCSQGVAESTPFYSSAPEDY